ncbi:MAG: TIM-barrel domain-containing protein [Myxococcota bacterium]
MRIHSLSSLVVLLPLVVACPPQTQPQPENNFTLNSGVAGVRVQLSPFELVVVDGAGNARLRTLSGGGTTPYGTPAATLDRFTVESALIPGWDGYKANEDPWQRTTEATARSRSDNAATLELKLSDGVLLVDVAVDGPRVKLHARALGNDGQPHPRLNKSTLAFALPADEHFFGLGERYASVDHRGFSLYAWAEEAGTGAGEDVPPGPHNPGPNGPSMTYFPVPFFHSSAGYGMHVDTTYRSEVHLGSEQSDAWRLAVNHHELRATIYVNDSPLDTLDQFTADTGRPVVPAPWVFGNRRRINRGAMREGVPEWQAMRQRNIPITGIDDAVHFLPHRSELGIESELQEWTSTLHRNGFKVMGYYNPYVSQSNPRGAEDYAYGRDHGLFIKDLNGDPALTFFISGEGQQIAAIDLSFEAGVQWFHTLLRRALALGYDGWMHDFGEYTDRDSVFHDGTYGDAWHNLYPVLSAKAAHELLSVERPDDHLFFVRSGYTGTQAYAPAVWSGDPEASFDNTQGVPGMLRGGLNLGLSGVPYWGSDVGGYKCLNEGVARDKELFVRWTQMGAVSPIMMDQDRCFHPLDGERPKWFLWDDEDTIEQYRRMALLHTRLQPYFLVLAEESHARGVPLMRHPFLLHPKDPEAWLVEDAFFLGPALYALPVVRRGVTVRDAWLPPGTYVDLDDHKVYRGGMRAQIPAPVEKLPLLLVANQVLPLLDDTVETLAPAEEPSVVTVDDVADVLDVVVALTPGGRAEVVLQDGTRLTAERHADDTGLPADVTTVTEADLKTCARCVVDGASGDVQRLRVNTELGTDASLRVHDVTVTTTGTRARRVRFDVLRVP